MFHRLTSQSAKKCNTYHYYQIFSCNVVALQLPRRNNLFSDEVAQFYPIQELPQSIRRCNHLIEERSKIEDMIEEMKLNLRLKEKFGRHLNIVSEEIREAVLYPRP